MSQPGLSALSSSVVAIVLCIVWPWHELQYFFPHDSISISILGPSFKTQVHKIAGDFSTGLPL